MFEDDAGFLQQMHHAEFVGHVGIVFLPFFRLVEDCDTVTATQKASNRIVQVVRDDLVSSNDRIEFKFYKRGESIR